MESISSLFDAFNDIFSVSDEYDSSDESYAEELQVQEAIEASLNLSSSSSSHDHHASSSSNTFSCQICTEDKQKSDMFEIEGCPHSFCQTCISRHVEYKLKDNVVHVSCPDEDCNNVLKPDSLRHIMLPNKVAQWEGKMTESTILDSEKFYCPFEDCSEMLVNDGDEEGVIRCECPYCWRLFCAQCKVPWHQGFGCEEFVRLKHGKKEKEELKLLAKENHWKKCPNCKVFVEKIEGCIHITCRCKFEFCYVCGLNWNESHWNTCQK